VTAGNPVAMLPESETTARALASREFVCVVDPFVTDTTRLAHLVLPTTTLLESDDLLGSYGHHWLGAATPVVPPPEGVLSDLEISTERSQSSQWSAALDGPAEATVHPDAAGGLADGAICRLESPIASMTVRLRLDARQRRDVVLTPKGGHLRDGRCANALVAA